MQGKDVARREQAFPSGFLNALGQIGSIAAGERKHIHAKLVGYLCHFAADVAQPDDAECFTMQLYQGCIPIAEVNIFAPSPFAIALCIVSHLVGEIENVGKGHLRHAVGAVGRNIGYDNTLCLSRLNVDRVIARRHHTDIAQSGQLRQDSGREIDFVDEQHFGILCTRNNILFSCSFINNKLTISF